MIRNLLTAVLLILISGCKKEQNEPVKEPVSVSSVQTAEKIVKDENIQGNITNITAAVMLNGIKKINIYSQTSGEIVTVSENAKLGKYVKAGEILIGLENSVQAANLKQAGGMLEEAKINFAANKELFDKNSISRAEFVRSQNNLFAAQTEFAAAQRAFKHTKITAPFSAAITMKNDAVEEGNNISDEIPLFTLVDLSKIKANIPLDEKEIGTVKTGAAAKVKVAAAGVELSGKITAISAGSNSQTGTFTAEAEFENPNAAVKDGMSGVISIDTISANTALKTNKK